MKPNKLKKCKHQWHFVGKEKKKIIASYNNGIEESSSSIIVYEFICVVCGKKKETFGRICFKCRRENS
jgi:hypothetical protein